MSRYGPFVPPGPAQLSSPSRPGSRRHAAYAERLAKENDTLAMDNTALVEENYQLGERYATTKAWGDDFSQRNVVFQDELHSAHRTLASVNEEKQVLQREKGELNNSNRIMLQRIQKLETMSRGREDTSKEISHVLAELRSLKNDLQADNTNLKKELQTKEESLHNLEKELVAVHLARGHHVPGSPGGHGSPGGYAAPESPTQLELRQDLQQRLKFLENVNRSLQSDNTSLNRSLDHLQRSITSLRESKMQDLTEIDTLTKDLEVQRRQCSSLSSSLKTTEQERDRLDTDLRQSREEATSAKASLQYETGPDGPMTKRIRSLEKTLHDTSTACQAAQSESQAKAEEIRRLQELADAAKRSEEALKAELEVAGANRSSAAQQWREEAEYLGRQLQEANEEHAAELEKLRDQVDKASHLATQVGKITELEAKIEASKKTLTSKDDTIATNRERIRQVEADLAHARSSLSQLEDDASALRESMRQLSTTNTEQESEMRSLRTALESKEEAVQHLRRKAQLQVSEGDQLQRKEEEMRSLKKALADKELELEGREQRLQLRNTEATDREKRMFDSEERIKVREDNAFRNAKEQQAAEESVLQRQVARLRDDLDQAMLHKAQAENERDALQHDLRCAEHQQTHAQMPQDQHIEEMQAQMMRLAEEVQMLQGRNIVLEEGNAALQARSDQGADAELRQLHDQMADIAEEVKLLQGRNARLQEENALLREQARDTPPHQEAPTGQPDEALLQQHALLQQEHAALSHRARAEGPSIGTQEELAQMERFVDDANSRAAALERETYHLMELKDQAVLDVEDLRTRLEYAECELRDLKQGTLVAAELRAECAESAAIDARRDACNAMSQSPERALSQGSGALSQGSATPRRSNKLQLWQAQALVESWKLEMLRIVGVVRTRSVANRALEEQLMAVHEQLSPTGTPPTRVEAMAAAAQSLLRMVLWWCASLAVSSFVLLAATDLSDESTHASLVYLQSWVHTLAGAVL